MAWTILKLCTSRAWGGMEMSMATSCERLRGRGHEVVPVCAPDSPIAERLAARDFQALPFDLRGKFHPRLAWRLGNLILARGVHLVHCDWSHDLFSAVPALARAPRVPLVLQKHVGVIRPKRLPVHVWLYRRVDHTIAISDVIRRNFVAMHPVGAERVSMLHHGVDPDRFTPVPSVRARVRRELGVQDDEVLVGIVGRVTPAKGHPEFLAMARRLVADGLPVRFVVVGEPTRGEELEGQAILASIAEHGLQDRVILTGFRDDVPDLLNAMDVFAFPSHAEAFGMALVEAMAAGLPAVSSDCDGVVDIVVQGETGFMVPPRDAAALTAAVQRLVENPGLRRELGAAARRRVLEHFTQEGYERRLEELYGSLIARRRGRG
ncbi:MAG: glycosyltransferase family 4 protein [Candidatus Krumholzibacteriia bacterium]